MLLQLRAVITQQAENLAAEGGLSDRSMCRDTAAIYHPLSHNINLFGVYFLIVVLPCCLFGTDLRDEVYSKASDLYKVRYM
jgi:hypothetical protein